MKTVTAILILLTGCCLWGCRKYLGAKPDKSLVIPSTLADFQALLDNNYVMNQLTPVCGESSADNYYITDDSYDALYSQAFRNMYVWGDEINFDLAPGDWETNYDQVYFANVVLEGVDDIAITAANAEDWNRVTGAALFFRGHAFLKVVVSWAAAYDSAKAGDLPGIPLRLQSDFAQPSVRSSLAETYRQILSDLKRSASLLPVQVNQPMRPSRPAVYALLARTFLAMRDYSDALLYADSCLQLRNDLMDYNAIDSTAFYPFPRNNTEVLFNNVSGNALVDQYTAKVDTLLYASYATGDLRRSLYFQDNGDGTHGFRGTYWGDYRLFTGIATDEVWLMKAECEARTGNWQQGLVTLNTLLRLRFGTDAFTSYTAASQTEALQIILTERRKELAFRDLRWMDIKRLNAEGAGISLTRKVHGITTELPPGDARFALPIPRTVIELTGMEQNPR